MMLLRWKRESDVQASFEEVETSCPPETVDLSKARKPPSPTKLTVSSGGNGTGRSEGSRELQMSQVQEMNGLFHQVRRKKLLKWVVVLRSFFCREAPAYLTHGELIDIRNARHEPQSQTYGGNMPTTTVVPSSS